MSSGSFSIVADAISRHDQEMATPNPTAAWALFTSDPIDFITMFVLVIGAVATFTWWLRGFLHKERIALSSERLESAQEDVRRLEQRLVLAVTCH
jgi:hypothetical protein